MFNSDWKIQIEKDGVHFLPRSSESRDLILNREELSDLLKRIDSVVHDNPSFQCISASITDIGKNPDRNENEDSLLCLEEIGLFAVADGVGGQRGGKMASQFAVDDLKKEIESSKTDDAGLLKKQILIDAFRRANKEILRQADAHPDLLGMATTLSALMITGSKVIIAHIGDSRVYLIRDDQIKRLTRDHTVVQEAIDDGKMTQEEAKDSEDVHVLTRALGEEEEADIDVDEYALYSNDRFLLVTDGVTNTITDEELHTLVDARADLKEVCQDLKRICDQRGAPDNLTAIVVWIQESDRLAPEKRQTKQERVDETILKMRRK